jgi:hypothetical protein
MIVTDLRLPEIYENTSEKSHDDAFDRHDRKYRGTVKVNGQSLPIVVHLLVLDRNKPNPNGHWSLTVHLNATDIYKGVVHDGKYWQHDNCLRCEPSEEKEVVDDYATPDDTRQAVLPVVRKWLAAKGVRVKVSEFDHCHTYFCSKPKRAKAEMVSGHMPAFATNNWRCHCPVHGKFVYEVEESLGM